MSAAAPSSGCSSGGPGFSGAGCSCSSSVIVTGVGPAHRRRPAARRAQRPRPRHRARRRRLGLEQWSVVALHDECLLDRDLRRHLLHRDRLVVGGPVSMRLGHGLRFLLAFLFRLVLRLVRLAVDCRADEHLVARPALALGQVHRLVGVADQVLGRRLATGADRDADTGRDGGVVSVDAERVLQRRLDPLGHRDRVTHVGNVLEQDRELVSTESRDRVLGPYAGLDPLGHRRQQPVAGVVTVGVVDRLEVVEVEEQHRDRGLAAVRALERVREPVREQRAVGKLGEAVVKGLVGEFLDTSRVRRPAAPRSRPRAILRGPAARPASAPRCSRAGESACG